MEGGEEGGYSEVCTVVVTFLVQLYFGVVFCIVQGEPHYDLQRPNAIHQQLEGRKQGNFKKKIGL